MQVLGSRTARSSFKYGQPNRVSLYSFSALPTTIAAGTIAWAYSDTIDLAPIMGPRQAIQLWRGISYPTEAVNGLVCLAAQFSLAQRQYGVPGFQNGLAFLDNFPPITLMDDWFEYTDIDFSDFTFTSSFLLSNPTGGPLDVGIVLKFDGALLNRVPQ